MKKGTWVKRSTYQKVCEENKKLLQDIKIMALPGMPTLQSILTKEKWRTKFKKDEEFKELLQEFAKEYLKKHPEYDIKSTRFTPPRKSK